MNIPKRSQYSWDQIEAAETNKVPIIRDGYWYRWDISSMQFVNTGVAAESGAYAAEAKASAESAIAAEAGAKAAAEAAATEAAAKAADEAVEDVLDSLQGYIDSSKSWAVGGTGARPGEDTNNSEYWADRAQAAAEQASVPPVEGVYNVILTDRVTAARYALLVSNGRMELLEVSETLEATDMTIIDNQTGVAYAIVVDDGRLGIEEVA